jgi:alcohol/geraniol dehydrogenase (NADP+)
MIKALAVKDTTGKLQPFEYQEEVGVTDVLVRVTHCGICHSDVHLIDGDWGDVYPLVPGHEIVGVVEKVGVDVHSTQIGDRVGIGWQCNSCGACKQCSNHKEVFCKDNQPTCMGHFGGFAEHVIADERFAIPLPDALESASAAPLLCAGATVFTPIDQYTKPGDSVAIVGIGGLGHLAIQIAKAKGCFVTAISQSSDKEVMSRELGADDFVSAPAVGAYDLILNTANVNMQMHEYLAALKPNGTFVQLGIAPDAMVIEDITNLVDGNKSIAGSAIAHPHKIQELLDLAAQHNIRATVQVMNMSEANAGVEMTRSNQARFRVVLEN